MNNEEEDNELEIERMWLNGYMCATLIWFIGEKGYKEFIERLKAKLEPSEGV